MAKHPRGTYLDAAAFDADRVEVYFGGPEGWRAFLADPGKHWRTGYSAKSLA